MPHQDLTSRYSSRKLTAGPKQPGGSLGAWGRDAARATPVATLATPTGNQRPACGQTGSIRQDMKNPAEAEQLRKQIVWCGRRESNPHERSSRDFKSLASTNSATSAPLLFSLA